MPKPLRYEIAVIHRRSRIDSVRSEITRTLSYLGAQIELQSARNPAISRASPDPKHLISRELGMIRQTIHFPRYLNAPSLVI